MTRAPRPLALAVLAGVSLAGCFGSRAPADRCNEVAEYQQSTEAGPVVAPPGLQVPAQTSGYAVPPAPGAGPDGAACLARPPPYFRQDPGAARPAGSDAGD